MEIEVINPSTNELLKSYQEMTAAQVTMAVQQSQQAFLAWREVPFAQRALLMKDAARILRSNAAEYAKLMALEMGKVLREGKSEAEKCAWVCEYYAENAAKFLATEPVATEGKKSFVTFQPLGVILAVMPWNFPLWQVFRFAAPALMAGNVALLKHSSNVPGCALAIAEIFQNAGFPKDVLQTLLVGSRQVEAIIEQPLVKAVTLTGSTPAGKAVASKAGAMLKKTVLELGGSDAYLVL